MKTENIMCKALSNKHKFIELGEKQNNSINIKMETHCYGEKSINIRPSCSYFIENKLNFDGKTLFLVVKNEVY